MEVLYLRRSAGTGCRLTVSGIGGLWIDLGQAAVSMGGVTAC